MAIFKLHRDILYPQWWRDYFEIEADSEEEAIQKLLDNPMDYYDTEMLDIGGDAIKEIIEDDNGKELCVIDYE